MAGKKTAILLAGLGVVLVAIQLVPVSRTNPPVEGNPTAPAEVQAILRTSCYDCHSNQTVWPWYSHVAPVSWLVASDTSEGRRHFNFSTWGRYSPEERAVILKRVVHEVHEGDMPPWYYTLKHTDAKLSPAQRATLEAWAAGPQS
jgi:hypothetical protein